MSGRKKIVVQDVVDKVGQIEEANLGRDEEGTDLLTEELYRLVLLGVQSGDFQGLTAKTMARLALSTVDSVRNR